MAKTIKSFSAFWPFYLSEHSLPATRAFHYAGTAALILVVVSAAWFANGWLLLLALPALYAFAWYSHFTIEHNKPATFTYPLWSLISDFRMTAMAATGRLGAELEKYQIRPRR